MSNRLEGKVAVITGGTSGIGLATVREFVELGAKVVFTGRKKDEVDRLAEELHATGIVSDHEYQFKGQFLYTEQISASHE